MKEERRSKNGKRACQMQMHSHTQDLINSGEWLKPGEISNMRRRLLNERTKTSKACTYCRKNKLKCDEGRPCKPCVKKALCCTSDDTKDSVVSI